jgi:hypothetical protein
MYEERGYQYRDYRVLQVLRIADKACNLLAPCKSPPTIVWWSWIAANRFRSPSLFCGLITAHFEILQGQNYSVRLWNALYYQYLRIRRAHSASTKRAFAVWQNALTNNPNYSASLHAWHLTFTTLYNVEFLGYVGAYGPVFWESARLLFGIQILHPLLTFK